MDDLTKALKGKPRLVAVGYASNALGTINPVQQIAKMAHDAGYKGRRLVLKQGIIVIRAYEYGISRALLEALEETAGVQIYGLQDVGCLDEHVPTNAIRLKGKHPRQVAEELDKVNI